MLFVPRHCFEDRAVDHPEQLGTAGRDRPRHRVVAAQVERIEGAKALAERSPLRVGTRRGAERADSLVVDQLDEAPVGQARHGQTRQLAEHRLDVEPLAEDVAGLDEEVRALGRELAAR